MPTNTAYNTAHNPAISEILFEAIRAHENWRLNAGLIGDRERELATLLRGQFLGLITALKHLALYGPQNLRPDAEKAHDTLCELDKDYHPITGKKHTTPQL